MRLKEYWKLKKLRELAEYLDYNMIVRIIDNDDEISEAYHEFKESGMTDEELREECNKYEFLEKNQVNIYEKIWDAIELYTDWEIVEVLEVYEGNCTPALFIASTIYSNYLVGEINNYDTPAPTWNEVKITPNETEAHEIFVKQLNLISGY